MAEKQKKRPRFSEGSRGDKASSVLEVPCSLAVTVSPASQRASRSQATSYPVAMTKPEALAKPASTVAVAIPVASTAPAAPSPVATTPNQAALSQKAEPEDGRVLEQGGGAMVAMAAEEKTVLNLDLKKVSKWIHCAACPYALKPPVFMCGDGHAVCCDCADASNHCGECGGAANYTRVPCMDGLVGALELPCPYNKFGCGMSIAYHAVAEHKARCAHAPCYCLECTPPFEGSPASILRHLTDPFGRHRWPVEKIQYDAEKRFILPASSEDHRRLLVAGDGRIFLLAVDAGRGPAGRFPVTVVCVRGNGRPAFKGTLTVECPPDEDDDDDYNMKLKAKVASCPIPSDVDMDDGLLNAYVTRKMLHGRGDSMKLHLSVRIANFP